MEIEGPLQIVEMRAENIARIKIVQIRPSGHVVEITGHNDQGKTSVMNAIAWACGGKEFAMAMPLRQGEDRGQVTIDFGQLKLTKIIERGDDGEAKTPRLLLEDKDGGRPRSPQTLLDELRGKMMDPIAFMRAEPKKRLDMARALVPDFDFAANTAARSEAYSARTDVNREHKRLAAQRLGINLPPGPKPAKVDIGEVNKRLAAATDANTTRAKRVARRDEAADKAEKLRDEAEQLRSRARILDKQAAEIEAQLTAAEELPEVIDTAPLLRAMQDASAINATVDKFLAAEALDNGTKALKARSDELTAQIEALDQAKVAAIAGGKFPVDGLMITDDDVTLGGIPFDQCAFSVRLRVSAMIAIALGAQIRVMLIREFGSLLDADAKAALSEIAVQHGWQVWIESVGDGGPGKVLIEDGMVMS